jgi:chromosome segregation ATPase
MLGEMKHLLEAASALDPDLVEQQQREYQRMISERDEQILGLSEQIDAIQAELTKLKSIPRDEDLEQLANELEQERCQLTQERRQLEIDRKQLREDEDELMKQMREMEVGMARERAELARQKMEMSRLHAEIRLELEQLQRGDLTMKERLLQFQRRHQDVIGRPGGAPAPNPMVAPPAAAPMSAPPSRRDSVIRKIFGSGGGSS